MKHLNENELVLIVEDDPHDAYFIQKAFEQADFGRKPHVCENGRDAIDYLEGRGQYGDRGRFPFPNWILTDLKMPIINGFEVLAWLKEHPDLRVIPTVIFTSSANPKDVKHAYCLGANAYFCKPSDPIEFRQIIVDLIHFWTRCERPPPEESLPNCGELMKEDIGITP